jgi:glycosyltransferase involved in cell wall biosynthesis
MRIGVVIEETWSFFHEIFAEMQSVHQTSLFNRRSIHLPFFEGRVNNYLFNHDLQSFLRSNQVVFFEWASELLVNTSRLPKKCGIVTRLHRYELYQWAEQINWEMVDRLILVSQAKQREFSQLFPQQAHKAVVIPEAISLEKFRPSSKEFNGDLGILCHLTPRKRVYELILAFSELVQQRQGFHLHIGGGAHVLHGDYYQAMKILVRRLDLEDKVTFYGNVSETEAWHKHIDIFISNSYSEGLQVSPMEAIGSGCYCLSHAWDGADELLPLADIYITDKELINKVLIYSDCSSQDRLSKREAQLAVVRENFDVDRIKVQIRRLVEEVGSHWM